MLESLVEARRVAPEHVRFHPGVRALLASQLDAGPTGGGRWVDFARWVYPPATTA